MRLPLRSFCILRSFFCQRQTTNPQRRGLSGAAMRLVQFHRHGDGGGIRVGVEQGEGLGVVDLKAFDPSMPSTMRELLELGDKGLECAQRYQTHKRILTFNHIITKHLCLVCFDSTLVPKSLPSYSFIIMIFFRSLSSSGINHLHVTIIFLHKCHILNQQPPRIMFICYPHLLYKLLSPGYHL